MEQLSNFIKTGDIVENVQEQVFQACCAVIFADVIAANTGIVPTHDHIYIAETSFKAATQSIQNKLQTPHI